MPYTYLKKHGLGEEVPLLTDRAAREDIPVDSDSSAEVGPSIARSISEVAFVMEF